MVIYSVFYKPKKKSRKKWCLLVIRRSKTGILNNSKPCTDCIKMMKTYGIYKIFYSNEKGDIVYEKVNNMISRPSSGRKYFNTLINKKHCKYHKYF